MNLPGEDYQHEDPSVAHLVYVDCQLTSKEHFFYPVNSLICCLGCYECSSFPSLEFEGSIVTEISKIGHYLKLPFKELADLSDNYSK